MSADQPESGSQAGGMVEFQDREAFAPSGVEERRKKRKRAKRLASNETPELNLIPIMGLFTAMVLYLLKSYASDPVNVTPGPDTRLPVSSSKLSPQEAVQVAISEKVILVNDKLVARVENGRVSAQYKKNNDPAQMFIEPLYEALRAEGDRQKMFARYNKKKKELQFKGLLTIIGDKRIPFRMLTEVLYTAGQAEYGSYKFAVLKKAT
jgi:hypothetical protein